MYVMQSIEISITILLSFTLFIFSFVVRNIIFLVVAIMQKNIQQENLGVIKLKDNGSKYKGLHRYNSPNEELKSQDLPFISILVATHNESKVIDRLMKSISEITYPKNRFEVIITDDSEDNTFSLLKTWQQNMVNLKVFHRDNREGWKGGALNLVLEKIDKNSMYVLVLDADTIVFSNILERFVTIFDIFKNRNFHNRLYAVQGYPISLWYDDDYIQKTYGLTNTETITCSKAGKNKREAIFIGNWVSRGISFRLAQRNQIEFIAKEKMNLPVQITGNLFMIRTNILKLLRFSHDLCEDWDLTLEIHLFQGKDNESSSNTEAKSNNAKNTSQLKYRIVFDPSIISFCESTKRLIPYFKQRMRVSEGHTRGFRKRLKHIINSSTSFVCKLELIFTGLRYIKFIPISLIILIDVFLIIGHGIHILLYNEMLKTIITIQIISVLGYITYNLASIKICKNKIIDYQIKDVFYIATINIFTIAAFAIGSTLGLIRNKGTFHHTERN